MRHFGVVLMWDEWMSRQRMTGVRWGPGFRLLASAEQEVGWGNPVVGRARLAGRAVLRLVFVLTAALCVVLPAQAEATVFSNPAPIATDDPSGGACAVSPSAIRLLVRGSRPG